MSIKETLFKIVVKKVKSGMRPSDICRMYPNVSPSHVSQLRRRFKMPKLPPRPQSVEIQNRINKIRKMKVAGYSFREIGNALKISPQRACQYLKISKERRDKSSCQKCGKSGIILHCHHTNYQTDEFIMLCPSCHVDQHPRGISKSQLSILHKHKIDLAENRKSDHMLGILLIAYREKHIISERKLAKLIGIEHNALNRFEHGKPIHYKSMVKIVLWLLQPKLK